MMACQAGESVVPLMGLCGLATAEANGEAYDVDQGDVAVRLRVKSTRLPTEFSNQSPNEAQKSGSDVFLCEFTAHPPYTEDRVTLLDPSIVREDPDNHIGYLQFNGDESLLSPILVRRYSDFSADNESTKPNAEKNLLLKSPGVEPINDPLPVYELPTSSVNVQKVLLAESSVKTHLVPALDAPLPITAEQRKAIDESAVPARDTIHEGNGNDRSLQNTKQIFSTGNIDEQKPSSPSGQTEVNDSAPEKENAPPEHHRALIPTEVDSLQQRGSHTLDEAMNMSKEEIDELAIELCEMGVVESDESKDEHQKCRDLTSAKKQLNISSHNFSERLRGAANLRKLEVVRSRDSLAAKEREHMLSIAAAKQKIDAERKVPSHQVRSTGPPKKISNNPYRPFKALPLPKAAKGDVGIRGVPKVDKHRATTPISPSLGTRRRDLSQHVSRPVGSATDYHGSSATPVANASSARQLLAKPVHGTNYKARSAVSAMLQQRSAAANVKNSSCEHGPVGGVKPNAVNHSTPNPQCPPSAKKYAVRGPTSRLLAGSEVGALDSKCSLLRTKFTNLFLASWKASRAKEQALSELIRREEVEAKALAQFKARPLPKFIACASNESPVLLGLSYLESSSTTDGLTTPSKNKTGFEPHSTLRAKKRAEFDSKRAANEEQRMKEERKSTQLLVQNKRRELNKLRQKIRRESVL